MWEKKTDCAKTLEENQSNINGIVFPEQEERGQKIFKEVMFKNFLILIKGKTKQNEKDFKSQKTPNKIIIH